MALILLLENDVPYAKTLRRALELDGHAVDWTADAQDAIHLADAHKPDLVITELLLGMHNGVEFLHEFRSYEDWQAVPIIVLSNVPPDVYAEVLKVQFGVTQYLTKSTTRLKLLRTTIDAMLVAA